MPAANWPRAVSKANAGVVTSPTGATTPVDDVDFGFVPDVEVILGNSLWRDDNATK